mmetsp:Transcript_27768/g.59364  ORF Transcript_27768/g.59364 Transcript_27768/m.59364 type:complete len:161 (-) Transcript_27768:583-1065(-)
MPRSNDDAGAAYAAPEPSKEIPILAYNNDVNINNNENDDDRLSQQTLPLPLPPEYAMIEINGNLIAPVEFPKGDTCLKIFGADKRVELGKLFLKGPGKTPMMILGNHELTGEVKKLDDPFCLMEKKYNEDVTPKQIESYQIIGIVKEKFLFENYPKAIMR